MVIAMPIVRMVKMTSDEVVDVIAMGHGLVAAAGAMDVGAVVGAALMAGRAVGRIRPGESDYMLIDMAIVEMMQMAIVQIVYVVIVLDGSMTTTGFVLMVVTRMGITGRHSKLLLGYSERTESG